MDMRNLGFERDTFDGVWAAASCVHVSRELLPQQLAQFMKVLKPNGILGITFQVERLPMIKEDGRFFEAYTTIDELIHQLEYAGFEIAATNEELTTKNTFNVKKVKKWAALIGRAPRNKSVILKRRPGDADDENSS